METGDSCYLEFHACADSNKLVVITDTCCFFPTRFIPRIHYAAVLMHYNA